VPKTVATQAVEDLEAWPGERFSHRPLLTTDRRLAGANGATCQIELI
jgi:hypothetical protein